MCQKVYNEVIKEQLRNQGFNHHLSLVNTILHLTFQSDASQKIESCIPQRCYLNFTQPIFKFRIFEEFIPHLLP